MSKTVLLPDELYIKIQNSKIKTDGIELNMSLAKKIELFFEFYMLKQFLQNSPNTTDIDLINTEIDN